MSARKDIERLVRSFVGQKMTPEYIRYYLQEAYQLDEKTIVEILEKFGIGPKGGPGGGKGGPNQAEPAKVKKQSFF